MLKKPSKDSAVDKINASAEKSTLGDIEALSALKEQMDEGSSKVATKKKAVKAEKEEDLEDEEAQAEKKAAKAKKASAKKKADDIEDEE